LLRALPGQLKVGQGPLQLEQVGGHVRQLVLGVLGLRRCLGQFGLPLLHVALFLGQERRRFAQALLQVAGVGFFVLNPPGRLVCLLADGVDLGFHLLVLAEQLRVQGLAAPLQLGGAPGGGLLVGRHQLRRRP
jgi:hypothetical protein